MWNSKFRAIVIAVPTEFDHLQSRVVQRRLAEHVPRATPEWLPLTVLSWVLSGIERCFAGLGTDV